MADKASGSADSASGSADSASGSPNSSSDNAPKRAPPTDTSVTPASVTPVSQPVAALGNIQMDQAVLSILEVGGGEWEIDDVLQAIHAACQDTGRAIEILSSGIHEQVGIPAKQPAVRTQVPPTQTVAPQAQVTPPSEVVSALGNIKVDETVQSIVEVGAGAWQMNDVIQALYAAHNDAGRAIEILFSGMHEQVGIPAIASSVQPAVRSQASQLSIDISSPPLGAHEAEAQSSQPMEPELLTPRPNRRGRLLERYSLPSFHQHRREQVHANVCYKDRMYRLEGPSSPFPMIDVSAPVPSVEAPKSSTPPAVLIARKMQAEASSDERDPDKLRKLKRSLAFVTVVESTRDFFDEEEYEDSEEEDEEEEQDE